MPLKMLKGLYQDITGFEIQLLLNFCFGVLFSPWTFSLFYTLLFFIVYEIVIYIYNINYSLETRLYIVMSYFTGYAIGRLLAGEDIII